MVRLKKIVRESIRDVVSESYNLGKLNSKMAGSFITPKRPYRREEGPYGEIEYVSPEELSGNSVRMKRKRLPAGYDGECYVVLLDDMLSFSELGKFNPKGGGMKHYFVIKCNNPEEAKTIAKNATNDYMRLLGIDTEMPEFDNDVTYNLKNSDECTAWL